MGLPRAWIGSAASPAICKAHLNKRQQRLSRPFIYLNGGTQQASGQVQPIPPKVAPRSLMEVDQIPWAVVGPEMRRNLRAER